MTAAISIEQVSKTFRIYHELNQTLKSAVMRRRRASYEEFWALRGVSLEIPEASTFALVGDNGSGKSTLLKCIAKILYPNAGTITARGRMAALLEVGSGFHPELSGRDNVYLNGSILGMTRPEIDRKFDEIVAFSGVERFIDQPVKNYSSGMYVRLGFSVAINVDPEILLVDEVLAVGDAAFQDKCAHKFAQFKREGRTVVVVSHSMPSLRAMADHAAWLSHGELMESGNAVGVLQRYLDSTHGDRHIDALGRTHRGSGEVRIETVEVGPAEGRDRIDVGDPARVSITYGAARRVDRPVIAFGVQAADGTHLGASNTLDGGLTLDHVDGTGRADCLIPSVPFHPGTYTLTASILDESMTHTFDELRDAAELTVSSGPHRWSGGHVAIPARWEVAAADRGAADGTAS
jgi:ABC-2 type transport system ATP-binding protein